MSRPSWLPLSVALEPDIDEVPIDPAATYDVAGVYSFGRGLFHRETLQGGDTSYATFHRLHEGQVVLSRLFAFEGAVAIVGAEFEGQFVSKEFPTFRVRERAHGPYLKHVFGWPEIWDQFAEKAGGLGVRRQRLHAERFLEVRVPLPGVEDQRRIAARLDLLFEQLDHVGALRERRRAVVAATSPALAHRHDLSDAEKTRKGWQRVPMQRVMKPSRDPVEVVPGEHYPNVGILNFGRGLFEKPPIDSLDTRATTLFRIRSGQFIYSRLFAFEGAYAVVPDSYDGYFVSNEFPTFDLDRETVKPDYLRAYFRAPHVWDELAAGSKGLGVRRRRVHPQGLLDHVAWLPPIDEQQRIGVLAERLSSAATAAASTDAPLKALRHSILNCAFADAG